jgi:hypothetical protein
MIQCRLANRIVYRTEPRERFLSFPRWGTKQGKLHGTINNDMGCSSLQVRVSNSDVYTPILNQTVSLLVDLSNDVKMSGSIDSYFNRAKLCSDLLVTQGQIYASKSP